MDTTIFSQQLFLPPETLFSVKIKHHMFINQNSTPLKSTFTVLLCLLVCTVTAGLHTGLVGGFVKIRRWYIFCRRSAHHCQLETSPAYSEFQMWCNLVACVYSEPSLGPSQVNSWSVRERKGWASSVNVWQFCAWHTDNTPRDSLAHTHKENKGEPEGMKDRWVQPERGVKERSQMWKTDIGCVLPKRSFFISLSFSLNLFSFLIYLTLFFLIIALYLCHLAVYFCNCFAFPLLCLSLLFLCFLKSLSASLPIDHSWFMNCINYIWILPCCATLTCRDLMFVTSYCWDCVVVFTCDVNRILVWMHVCTVFSAHTCDHAQVSMSEMCQTCRRKCNE